MNTKRILSFMLAFAMIFSAVSMVSVSASNSDIEWISEDGKTYHIRYINNNTEVMITSFSNSIPKNYEIPSVINGKPVTAIGDEVFKGRISADFILPDTIKYIGEYAFGHCKSKTINIPASVEYISPLAFACSTTLQKFTVDENNPVYKAVDGVLYSKDGSTLVMFPDAKPLDNNVSYTIDDGVKYIYDYAFAFNSKLKNITFPDTLKIIGTGAFRGSILEKASFPEGLEYISDDAFAVCDYFIPVNDYPKSLKYVSPTAFDNSAWNYSFSGVYYINDTAYRCRTGLEETTLADNTRVINSWCFLGEDCQKLKKVYIPASVDEIYLEAFYKCPKLREIIVDEDNPYFTSVDGMLFTKDKTQLLICPSGRIKDAIVPDGTKIIATKAFAYCIYVNEIKLPETITTIGNNAFIGCDALKKIAIPKNVEMLGDELFNLCDSIENISINCLTTNISAAELKTNPWYNNLPEGVIYSGVNAMGYKNMYIDTTTLNFDNSTRTIANAAFLGYYNLKEINLPENLEKVGYWAFGSCSGVKSVTIPQSVQEIGEYAFGYNYYYDEYFNEVIPTPIEGFVIKGYTNSVAHKYAKENGFDFVSVGYMDPESTLLGDVDGDGRLTVKDATAIQKYVAGMVGLNTQDKINADFNLDGKINVRDATAIQKRLANITR